MYVSGISLHALGAGSPTTTSTARARGSLRYAIASLVIIDVDDVPAIRFVCRAHQAARASRRRRSCRRERG